MKAIIFGSIGTLVETSDIQRQSFNQAFKEIGLDWYWDKNNYKNLLKKSGGRNRVEYFANINQNTVDSKKIRELKTQYFNRYLNSNIINPREGVLEVIKYAKLNNIKIGLASTTTIENIDAIFTTLKDKIIKKKLSDLTSLNNKSLKEIGHTKNVKQLVLRQAALIKKSGCDGIVCSAQEALMVRKRYKNLLIITPGIRLPGDSSNDQMRIMTPKQAFKNKVSGIVIGRSLTKGNIRNNTKKLIDHLNK